MEKRARVSQEEREVPSYLAIVIGGQDRKAEDDSMGGTLVRGALHLGQVTPERVPHIILLSGNLGEASRIRRVISGLVGGFSSGRVHFESRPHSTLHDRAEAMWHALPHNGFKTHPLVMVVAPEPLLELVREAFGLHAQQRHHERLGRFRFVYRSVAVDFSAAAEQWSMRGPRRFGLWAWSARVYYRLRRYGWHGLWPEPRLS